MTTAKNKPFIFTVVTRPSGIPKSANRAAFLIEDRWDDWGEFETLFHLIVFDEKGTRHEPGDVKIGMFNLIGAAKAAGPPNTTRKAWISDQFSELDEGYFSLGQDDSYYVVVATLSEELRDRILTGLRDVVADQQLWKRARNEEVIVKSLLRSVKRKSVEGQFRRILSGGARLTPYSFTYTPPRQAGSKQPTFGLSFEVIPDSNPPTNIHVLIGPNGVGKTHLLHLMTKALVAEPSVSRRSGKFSDHTGADDSPPIANLVSVSFSAFDNFELIPERHPTLDTNLQDHTLYSYIGLRRANDTGKGRGTPKSGAMLTTEFVKSMKLCLQGARLKRWRRALEVLEADPLFKEANVSALSENLGEVSRGEKRAAALFRRLSAGHKIVLLTITRLVETVDEQTLVLLDEPEAHLHPPLLSAFVRTLSDLLINRNGVAIIATHSPVVLQEVPKTCVWLLQRVGNESKRERLETETFGENVGVLTREVFGLQVTQSGFHKMLSDAVDSEGSFESAVAHFDSELGGEARAILRALFVNKDSQNTQ